MPGAGSLEQSDEGTHTCPEHSSETGASKPILPRLQAPKKSDPLGPFQRRGQHFRTKKPLKPSLKQGPSQDRKMTQADLIYPAMNR